MFYTISRATNTTNTTFSMDEFDYLRAPVEDDEIVYGCENIAIAAFTSFTNGGVVANTEYTIHYDLKNLVAYKPIKLPVFPLSGSITSATFYNEDNEASNASVWALEGDDRFVITQELPADLRDWAALKIVADFGFNEVPKEIESGVFQYMGFLYENRGEQSAELPDAVAYSWSPFIRYGFGV